MRILLYWPQPFYWALKSSVANFETQVFSTHIGILQKIYQMINGDI